jgi:hypothetical protein
LDDGEEFVVVEGAVLDLGEAVGQEDPIFEGDVGLVAEYHVSELCPGFTIGRQTVKSQGETERQHILQRKLSAAARRNLLEYRSFHLFIVLVGCGLRALSININDA